MNGLVAVIGVTGILDGFADSLAERALHLAVGAMHVARPDQPLT